MAQYEVHIEALREAAEHFGSAAGQLDAQNDRLGAVLGELSESLTELRQQLATSKNSIGETTTKTREISLTLKEISEIYAGAERIAFADVNSESSHPAAPKPLATPITVKKPAFVLFENILMPEWLQIAVLKYEQSQTNIVGGSEI